MISTQREHAQEIHELANKLTFDGWDRLRGLRLIHAATQVLEECTRTQWTEAAGRAGALAEVLGEFVRDTPKAERLVSVMRSANELADLLMLGRMSNPDEQDLLPENPRSWTLIMVGAVIEAASGAMAALRELGFLVKQASQHVDIALHCQNANTILLADANWLAVNATFVATLSASNPTGSLMSVAVVKSDDFLTQIKARQAGASLLLDAPLDAPRLIGELAGFAWTPRVPYRVMLVDDDAGILALHAEMLRAAGFEVLALDDPVAARDLLEEFVPDACVLDVEMPACKGTDLAAMLRRDPRFTWLPILYLSAYTDFNHQLDARRAGGEDYLAKPVDARLLVSAVLVRARQFRMFEMRNRQRRFAWRQLDSLGKALDVHAIVSVANAEGVIIDANRKFCEVSGYSREELLGRNHRIVKSGHHPAAFFEGMWQQISSGQLWQGEVQNRRKDGSPYWVQSTIAPILDEQGLPEQYVSIRTDITEQKRLLAIRERQGRLLDLLRQALQHFIASHDVAASADMLLDGMLLLTDSSYGFIGELLYDAEEAPYLQIHALTNIGWKVDTRRLYEAKHLAGMAFHDFDNLFGAVLRTGKAVIANDPANDPRRGELPAGHPALEAFLGIPVHYGDMLVGMVGLANRPGGYDETTLDFLSPLAATYASVLEASRLRHFQQIVIDDLQRARNTADRSNQAKNTLFTAWGHALRSPLNAILGHAQLLQMNSGLDAETAEQIDEIVAGGQQIADMINDLLSRLDIGEKEVAKQPFQNPVTAINRHAGARRRILIAEDNPANQAVLRMQLDVLGFDADLAVNGAVALAKWKSGSYELLLADRNMPGMDGLELTRSIRAAERDSGAHLPIIAITAVHQPEELTLCIAAGMDDALPKPIELDDLHRLLLRWLPRALPLTPELKISSAKPDSGAVLDIVYIERIIGHASPEQIRKLVDLFTETARLEMPSCRRMLKAQDGRGLAQAMHKLKSSARMVGALQFALRAEAIENVAKSGRFETLARLIAELELSVDDVETAAGQLVISPWEEVPAEEINSSGLATSFPERSVLSLPSEAMPRCVLVVDDDPMARRQLDLLLTSLGCRNVLSSSGGEAALAEIAREGNSIDLIVSDLNMPGMDGIEFLRRLAEFRYTNHLIIYSGVEDRLLQTAADLARAKGLKLCGAIRKPMTQDVLVRVLMTACEKSVAPTLAAMRTITPEEILDGIQRDQFSVHFQPKVEADTLRVVGVEALARWQLDGKPVRPDVFIATAEQSGLIGALSEMLATKAMIGGVRLAQAGFPISVAVNLSANWLSDVNLPEFFMASIHATGFNVENLILEITETGVMTDITTSLDVITRLRLKGFKLSIDDFGTGYSSMDQLQRFPFSELKLDRSFVDGAAEKPAKRAILASSIEMAKKLNLTTVAEGVETQADLDLVRGLGCDQVQGWYIAKAMPLEALIPWLHQRLPLRASAK